MADRSVKVVLSASVDGYVAGMKRAAAATQDVAKTAARMSQDQKQSWDKVSNGAIVAGAGMVAAVGGMVKVNANFEKSMSGVKAVTNATSSEFTALQDAAKRLGADTSFSASQAAQAEAELAKAGVSVADILGGALKGSLDLAAAGQIDVSQAAEISAQAMNIFGLSGKDVGHVADVLAAAANKSAADVTDLGMGLSQVGSQAKQTGLSLEDTTAALALFADNGVKGSDAGTSLKTMLMRLTPASKEAATAMDGLGLSFYDSQGKFVGMEEASKRLQDAMGDLSDEERTAAMNTIFGADASRAANILLDSQSEKAKAAGKAWGDYRKGVNDAGAASRMAATQLDNLAGDWEKLQGALETTAINGSGGLSAGLRTIVQQATSAIDVINKIPPGVASVGTTLATSLGGGALLMGGVMKGIGAVNDYRTSFTKLQTESPKTAKAVKGVGVALLGIAALQFAGAVIDQFSGIGLSAEDAKNKIATMQTDLEKMTLQSKSSSFEGLFGGGIGNLEDVKASLEYIRDGSWDAKLGKGLDGAFSGMFGDAGKADYQHIADSIHTVGDALASVSSSDLPKAQAAFKDFYNQVGGGENGAELLRQMPAYQDALRRMGTEAGVAVDDTNMLRYALGELQFTTSSTTSSTSSAGAGVQALGSNMDSAQASVEDLEKSLDSLEKAIREVGGEQLSLEQATAGWEAALDSANAAIAENGRTLDLTTEKGRANRDALTEVGDAAKTLAISQAEAGNLGGAVKQWDASRAQLVKLAMQMGATKTEAEALATARMGAPGQAKDLITELAAAKKALDDAKNASPADLSVSAPGAKEAADDLNSARQAAEDLGMGHGSAVQVTAPGAKEAAQDLSLLSTAANQVPPMIAAPTSAPGASQAATDLNAANTAATNLSGKAPAVTVTAPGSTGVNDTLRLMSQYADGVDAKSPTVNVSAPGAQATTGLLSTATGAATTLDSKAPAVSVSAPGATLATGQLNTAAAAASNADAKSASIPVLAPGATLATGQIGAAGSAADAVDGKVSTITIRTIHETINSVVDLGAAAAAMAGKADGGWIPGRADGGYIPGPWRGPTADNVLGVNAAGVPFVRVNPKEFITRVASAESMRREFPGWLEHINMFGRPPGFADGGPVDLPRYASGSTVTSYSVLRGFAPATNDILSAVASTLGDRGRAISDAVKQVYDLRLAWSKAAQDARLATGADKTRALAEQAKAAKELANAQRTLNTARAAGRTARTQEAIATGRRQNKYTAQFIAAIRKLEARGFVRAAAALLEDGSAEAQAQAIQLASGNTATVREYEGVLSTSSANEAALAAMKKRLGIGAGSDAGDPRVQDAKLRALLQEWAAPARRFGQVSGWYGSATAVRDTRIQVTTHMPASLTLNVDGQQMTAYVAGVASKTITQTVTSARRRV